LQRWRVAFGTPIWFGPFRRPSSTFTVSTPMMSRTSSSRQAAPSNLVCQFALNRRLEYVVTSECDNGVEEITSQQYQDMLDGLSDVPARAPRAASPGNSPRCSSSFPRKKNGDWWRYLLQSALHDAIELERARAATASRKRGQGQNIIDRTLLYLSARPSTYPPSDARAELSPALTGGAFSSTVRPPEDQLTGGATSTAPCRDR
jgi:hypothetical protein